MDRNHILARYAALAAAVVCIAVLSGSAAALTINGRVVNGTTGDENLSIGVTLLNPSEGMEPVAEMQTVAGKFTFDGLDGDVPIYLLRVDYLDVLYTQMVRPSGSGAVDATVSVYDTTSSWEGIHVLVPHLAAMADPDNLEIETLYEIHNHVDPPRTITGMDAQLRIYIPEDKIEILRSFVSHEEVPIDRFPVPTDSPGVYRIDYPIRPGETKVGISYSVPYPNKTYSLSYKLNSDIEGMTLYAVNPGMKFTSETLELGNGESVQGMTAYDVTGLTKGSSFRLTISGGEPVSAATTGQGGGGGQSSIVILPAGAENVSIMVMVIVLLALLAFLGIATHGETNPLGQEDQVRTYYNVLLKRMAKLDDLRETGMVAADVYSAKRAELKTQIAALMYHLHTGKGGKKRSSRAKRTPPVAGKESTSTP
jgi:hypothetical protein